MPTRTIEQYTKTIFNLQRHRPESMVGMKSLSAAMGVTPGTATTMAKQLQLQGLIQYEPRRGVELTAPGRELAIHLIRRHRLIETFLEQVLGYDWSEVHGDAEELEHAVSDRFIERIDRLLGYPKADPHGDPIPTASGVLKPQKALSLNRVAGGERIEVVRLIDDSPRLLQLMKSKGIVPGNELLVQTNDPDAGTITVADTRTDTSFVCSLEVATQVMVRVVKRATAGAGTSEAVT